MTSWPIHEGDQSYARGILCPGPSACSVTVSDSSYGRPIGLLGVCAAFWAVRPNALAVQGGNSLFECGLMHCVEAFVLPTQKPTIHEA